MMQSYMNDDVALVKIKKRQENAIIPNRQSEQSPGYELYACEFVVLEAEE